MSSSGIQDGGRDSRPVYRRIAEDIRGQVERGSLGAGDRLPTIRALASELGVNRDTISLAYEALAAEGLVESVVGRGTFVRRSPREPERGEEPIALSLAPQVEQLIAMENARPRFGVAEDVVALHSLIPDPSFYPVEEFRRCLNRVLSKGGAELFLYGAPQGHPGLREVIAGRLRAAGIELSSENVVLCHGASQGIALAIRLFTDVGDCVAVEAPTYHNVLATLAGLGLRPAPVAMDAEGPDLDALDRVLARPEVKAFYTIPTFHNPMGTTTSLRHRERLLEIAARHGTPVIEDGYEMDLRYSGRSVPSLAALDGRGLVVLLSSFSKSLFPGLRIGSLALRGRGVEGLVALKHATDLSDSMPLQAALEEFLRSGAYDKHLARLRRALRGRRDVMLEALEEKLPEGTRFTRPDGGYQVWVELPFEIDTRDLLADAARAGVLFAPGSQFLPEPGASRCLRLTIARASEEEIRQGVAVLGRLIEERRAAKPAAREAASVNV
ncbi:MAG: PLP-dependent aminotransferase family protein [Deltaproteobacteria bacterium]|nr:PLP-dependent aminotransferase family protein [Deltaproteobacteria bacterium]MBW2419100.1 PLP-dependent aminotransferase family protein [Deltaproteobacteria bacterium]